MQDFRKLGVWHKALALGEKVYAVIETFPSSEKYAMVDQLKRAAGSVPANIAEGCSRRSGVDFCRFLRNSLGSANEVESHIELACRVRIVSAEQRDHLVLDIVEVRKMLTSLIITVQSRRK